MMKMGDASPCDKDQLMSLLNIPADHPLVQYEELLCGLNWTAVMMEMAEHDPDLQEYQRLVSYLNNTLLEKPSGCAIGNQIQSKLSHHLEKHLDNVRSNPAYNDVEFQREFSDNLMCSIKCFL